MAIVTARIKIRGNHYEIKVDLDEALKVRDGKGDIVSALESPSVYHDVDKGEKPTDSDLERDFGTTDIHEIAKKIITKGEVQKTQEFRDEQKEKKISQVISLLLKNASDQHGNPYTEDRLRRAISEVSYNFDNRPAEQQMQDLLHKLKEVIPIKLELKKVKLTIPAQYTGQVYGILQDFKESEEWLANGSLQAVLNIPAGMQIDFYEKLNHITHGAVQSEEIVE